MRISVSALGLLATLAITSALPVDSFHEDAAHTTTTTTTKHTTTTKTSTAATSHPTAPYGREVAIKSQTDFCLFLPPHPGDDVATTEDTGVLYCAKGTAGAPGAKTFPSGFITTAHYAKSSTYIQVTGYLDRTKYELKASDEGGQYDNHGNGKPTGAQCKGYNYFVSLVEPANDRFCIRCCQNKVDCNTGRSGYGCERVVPGDYTQSSSHTNTDFNTILDELPNYTHLDVIPSPNNNTANSPLLAFPQEIVTLETLDEGNHTADQIKTEWSSFITKLESEYPNNAADIQKLDAVTANITDVTDWEQFIELLKTKVDTYLYPGQGTDDNNGTTTGGDDTTDNTTPPADDIHANEWQEDDITSPNGDNGNGNDTNGDNTDPTNNGTSTGTISDSFNDYVTLQDLDEELNSKFDDFNTKILGEIQDLLNSYGNNPSASIPPSVTPTSEHNNQATW